MTQDIGKKAWKSPFCDGGSNIQTSDGVNLVCFWADKAGDW